MSEPAVLKKVKKHRLILFDIVSKRLRNKLLLLLLIMLGLGVYDLDTQILDDSVWYYYWITTGLVFLLWFYYALLMPRSSIQARPKSLRLQGPFYAINISYGRIYSVTLAQMGQHFPYNELKWSDKGALKPLYNRTCVFIELKSFPKPFRWRHLWFPKYLFGTSREGLVCVIEDWLELSRDVEAYRSNRYERVHNADRGEAKSLASKVLTDT